MLLHAGYFVPAASGGDNVPDGPAAMPSPDWQTNQLTRTVGGSELNPPLVTLTDNTVIDAHSIWRNGGPTIGPTIRSRFYIRAGTRRYVVLLGSQSARWVAVTVDTVNWVITSDGVASATILSATVTSLGDGDYLVDIYSYHGITDGEWTTLHGTLNPTGGNVWTHSYQGNGSTILVRRIDVETVAHPSPVLGAGTITKAATTGTSLTGTTQHTPAERACVVRYLCRTTVTNAYNTPTATFQGQPIVFPASSQAHLSGAVDRCLVGVGYVTGLAPGTAGSFVLTSNRAMGQMVARIDDVASLSAGVIGVANASSYGSTAKNNHAIGVVTAGASSLLLGVVGGTSGSLDPFSVTGFAEQAEDVTGTAATDVAAVFGSKTGGAAGATETMTATGAATSANWGGAVLELKAA